MGARAGGRRVGRGRMGHSGRANAARLLTSERSGDEEETERDAPVG